MYYKLSRNQFTQLWNINLIFEMQLFSFMLWRGSGRFNVRCICATHLSTRFYVSIMLCLSQFTNCVYSQLIFYSFAWLLKCHTTTYHTSVCQRVWKIYAGIRWQTLGALALAAYILKTTVYDGIRWHMHARPEIKHVAKNPVGMVVYTLSQLYTYS